MNCKSKKIFKITLVFWCNFSCIFAYSQLPKNFEFIKSANLLKTVAELTKPEYDGRFPASDGYKKAAVFMAEQFKLLGLKDPVNNNFLQPVSVEYNEIINGSAYFSVTFPDKKIKKYNLGNDYVFRGFTGQGDVEGELVFCGYGISSSENNWDDYKNIDVKNKVVVVFKQNPSWKIGNIDFGKWLTRKKAKTAMDHGAKAIIFVTLPLSKQSQKPIGSLMDGEEEYLRFFPQLHVDVPFVEEWFLKSNFNFPAQQKKIDSLKVECSIKLNVNAHIILKTKYIKSKESYNVVAYLEGENKNKANQFIIVGAHLDHVGRQSDDMFFPGANDNASGCAAVLEIARAFVEAKIKQEHSIVFILFTSEESGLIGSKYFVNNPVSPLENCLAMVNLDCVASGDSIQIGAGKAWPKLWNIAHKNDSLYFKKMIKETWNGGGADAEAFHVLNIPVAYFVSKYSYTHLHLPTDKVETLNADLFEKITRLAFCTIFDVASGKYIKENKLNK